MIPARSFAFLDQVHSFGLAFYVYAETSLVSLLDLERYSQLASLTRGATSIRLFHLWSIEAAEGELRCSEL